MISRRTALAGLTSVALPGLAGCGGRPAASVPAYYSAPYVAQPIGTSSQAVAGLDAVIDMSHMVAVSDFSAIRHSGILAVVHKASEGGDWIDPSYGARRHDAEAQGLLWGAYHFGSRQ